VSLPHAAVRAWLALLGLALLSANCGAAEGPTETAADVGERLMLSGR